MPFYYYGLTMQGALSANTTQTMLEIKPATNNPVMINYGEVSFDGATAGAGIRVQMIRQTSDGTGTASPPTPQKKDPNSRAALCTILWKLSAEGSLDAVLGERYVQQYGGLWILQWPLGQEWRMLEGGNRFGLRIITPASVSPNVAISIEFGE